MPKGPKSLFKRVTPPDFRFASPSPVSLYHRPLCRPSENPPLPQPPPPNTAFQPNKGPVPGQIRPAPSSPLVPTRTYPRSAIPLCPVECNPPPTTPSLPNIQATNREKGKYLSPITPIGPTLPPITLLLHPSSRPATASPVRQNPHPSSQSRPLSPPGVTPSTLSNAPCNPLKPAFPYLIPIPFPCSETLSKLFKKLPVQVLTNIGTGVTIQYILSAGSYILLHNTPAHHKEVLHWHARLNSCSG